MAHSSGAKTYLAYVAEATWGTTPATPTMKCVPFKTFSLKPVMETYSSAQMNPNRQKQILALGVLSSSAELSSEFVPQIYDDFMASVFCSNWTYDVLKIGVTDSFFTLEEGHNDILAYHTGKGMLATKFSLSCKPGFVECGFSFLGKSFSVAATSGATSLTDVPDDDSVVTMTAVLSEGGTPIATITSLDFTLENALDLGKPCNAATASGFAVGMASLKGKLTAYFENDTMMSKFLAGTPTSITVQVGDDALGGQYTFEMLNVRYTGADTPVDKEGLLAVALDFEALYDDATDSVITVTRDLTA